MKKPNNKKYVILSNIETTKSTDRLVKLIEKTLIIILQIFSLKIVRTVSKENDI